MENNKDVYFVAVKVFFEDAKGRLLITKDKFGDWDLPGGRLRTVDFDIPLEEIVERKIMEELGPDVRYKLGKPVVFMRHEREELLPSGDREQRRIFALGYEAKFIKGVINLGRSHERYEWVALKNFKPEQYLKGGWLQGVKDYMKLNKK